MKHTYDPELIAEASMAIWEYMIENRDNPQHLDMKLLWETHGTVEMRHFAYRLSLSALKTFYTLGLDWLEEHKLLPYDWEFMPAVVRAADFSQLYEGDNSPSAITRRIEEKVNALL